MNVTIYATDQPDAHMRDAIVGPLVAYNTQRTSTNDHRPLVLTIKDDSTNILGGLWGRTAFDWLFIELLYVPDALRGQGIGATLMNQAEQEAISRGCHSAWLDTFEFQARGFYERLGYCCFGELENYPSDFSRYFLQKKLITPHSASIAPKSL